MWKRRIGQGSLSFEQHPRSAIQKKCPSQHSESTFNCAAHSFCQILSPFVSHFPSLFVRRTDLPLFASCSEQKEEGAGGHSSAILNVTRKKTLVTLARRKRAGKLIRSEILFIRRNEGEGNQGQKGTFFHPLLQSQNVRTDVIHSPSSSFKASVKCQNLNEGERPCALC